MACQITIRSVNGIIPVGGTQITSIRVTGLAIDCPSGVVMSSTITAPTPMPAIPDANGHFLLEAPLLTPGSINCGDPFTVTATCQSNSGCWAQAGPSPLKCCELQIITVDGLAPQGALAPTSIRVSGTAYGCATNQVALSTIPAKTTPLTVMVDPLTGSFSAILPVSDPTLLCGATGFELHAACVSVTSCPPAVVKVKLDCSQCFRAQISATVGPCSGMPPTANVNFTAQIALPVNSTGQFRWLFEPGSQSAITPVTISSGAPAATATLTGSHAFGAGMHTVQLLRTDVEGCQPVLWTFTVNCDGCPQITPSVSVGPCETSGPAAGSRLVTYSLTFNPPLGAGDTAFVTINYGGPDINGATSQSTQVTGVGTFNATAHLDTKAGGYSSSANVTIVGSNNTLLCVPPPTVPFSTRGMGAPPVVDVAACLNCPTVQVVVTPPTPPLMLPNVQFQAQVTWPTGTMSPPSPVNYTWTVTLPDGRQAKCLNCPASVTTQGPGWTGNGATASSAVDLSAGGTYGVAATANFAATAGLPTDPVTGVPTCDLTGPSTFSVAGPVMVAPPPPPPPPPTGGSPGCIFLLVASIILLLVGAIVVVVGVCIGVWLVIVIGAAIGVIGLVLFLIWIFACAAITPCSLMLTMECILFWIIATAWIIALIVTIIGGLPCGIAAFSAWGGWALIDAALRTVMYRVKCPPIDCTMPHP